MKNNLENKVLVATLTGSPKTFLIYQKAAELSSDPSVDLQCSSVLKEGSQTYQLTQPFFGLTLTKEGSHQPIGI